MSSHVALASTTASTALWQVLAVPGVTSDNVDWPLLRASVTAADPEDIDWP